MKRRILTILTVLALLISMFSFAVAAADVAAIVGETEYADLQTAVNDVIAGTVGGTIQLQKSFDDAAGITVNGNVILDLNGCDISSVEVTGENTLYVIDSKTKDFDVDDGEGYGKINEYTGNVQALCTPEADGMGWLMFSDTEDANASFSFHYVELRITDMTLTPKVEGETEYNPSVSYKCFIAGDSVVKENVETFGVALSIAGDPSEVGLKKCGYSEFMNEDFESGEEGNATKSTLLRGIMKESNLHFINARNANLRVYGQAYLQLKGEPAVYIYGNAQDRTLKEQTEEANKRWTLLNTGKQEDQNRKQAFVDMVGIYSSIMESWDLSDTDYLLNGEYSDVVYDAYSWYKEFENLKVASEEENLGMLEDDLRQLCVDFFRLQQSFKWTPNTTFVYHDTEELSTGFSDYTTLAPDTVYKGLPYCMTGAYHVDPVTEKDLVIEAETSIGKSGSIYKALNFYDPATGVLDLAAIYARNGAKAVYDVLTSNCTHGLTWGWNRVSNSTTIYSTKHYTPANGALFVGYNLWNEYLYSEVVITNETTGAYEIKLTDNAVTAIMKEQPEGRWRNNYAKMQPGDGLLSDGHLRMCTGVRVKMDADDNIIPGESYVWYIDMNSNGSTDRYVAEGGGFEDYTYTQDNGNLVRDLGGIREHVDREGLNDYPGTPITFTQLYNEKYMPVTIPEFVDQARIETIRDQSKAYFEAAGELEKWTTYYEPKYQALIDNMAVEAGDVWFTLDSLNGIDQIAPSAITGMTCSIKANYVISNVRITLQDSNEKVLLEEDPIIHTNDRTISLKVKDKVLPVSTVLTDEVLTDYAGEGNQIIISVQLSTGQWLDVLNAELIAG